jgi:hypothetical protein
VLGNSIGRGPVADVAWLYCSDDVLRLWDQNPSRFVEAESVLRNTAFQLRSPIAGIVPPSGISCSKDRRIQASTLFRIEKLVIGAMEDLQDVLKPGNRIKLEDFERRLARFGSALMTFDRHERELSDNNLFAVFDGLIQVCSPASAARSSSLTFTSVEAGQERSRVFTQQAALLET